MAKLDSTLVGKVLQAKATCPPGYKVIATKEGILMTVKKNSIDRLFDRLNGKVKHE